MTVISAIFKRACIILVLLACVLFSRAADEGNYTKLINDVSELPSETVLRRGDESLMKGKSDEAMVLYMVVCRRADDKMTVADRELCAQAYLKAGDIYYGRGDYTRSLDFYAKGLELCEVDGCKFSTARFYKNIGNVYARFDDYERASEYYKDGLRACKDVPDVVTERKILINLTGMYIAAGKPAEAQKYYEASLRVKGGDDNVTRFMKDFNHSLIMAAYGKYAEAVPRFRRLAAYAVASGLAPQYECCAYQELYRVFDKMGCADSTFFYLRKCEQVVVKHGVRHQFVDLLKDAADIFKAAGMPEKAMEYRTKYFATSDSIFNQREFSRVKNAQFYHEMDKADKEIKNLRRMHEQSRQTIERQRNALAIGLSVLFVVTFFVAMLYRQNRKLNESYAGLYVLNRDFIDRQERMDRRHAEDLDRISRIEAEADALRARLEEPQAEPNGPAAGKYRSSNLNDMQQQALAEAIMKVMDGGEEFCRDDFSLDRLAALVGSNSKYVSQVINSTYNKNFSNFVNEYRIRTACKRLADAEGWGNLTVKAVGESVGYKSHATFVNIFKKITGLTPSLYQKMAKSGS